MENGATHCRHSGVSRSRPVEPRSCHFLAGKSLPWTRQTYGAAFRAVFGKSSLLTMSYQWWVMSLVMSSPRSMSGNNYLTNLLGRTSRDSSLISHHFPSSQSTYSTDPKRNLIITGIFRPISCSILQKMGRSAADQRGKKTAEPGIWGLSLTGLTNWGIGNFAEIKWSDVDCRLPWANWRNCCIDRVGPAQRICCENAFTEKCSDKISKKQRPFIFISKFQQRTPDSEFFCSLTALICSTYTFHTPRQMLNMP